MGETLNVNDVVVEYRGDRRTIRRMLNDLEKGMASYWFWHTFFTMFELKYREIRAKKRYGILLSELPIIGKTYLWELEGKISQGSYNQAILGKLVEMYAILLEESVGMKKTVKCGICGMEYEELQTAFTIMYTNDLPVFHVCDECKKTPTRA